MRPEELSDALHYLDEEIITETATLRNHQPDAEPERFAAPMDVPKKKTSEKQKAVSKLSFRMYRHQIGLAAACVGLLIIGGIFLDYFTEHPLGPNPSLENSSAEESTKAPATHAGETWEVMDTDDLVPLVLSETFGNQGSGFDEVVGTLHLFDEWWYNTPTALPVYQNCYYTADHVPYGYGRKEMERKLSQIIAGLGVQLMDSTYEESTKYESATLTGSTELATIQIDGTGTVNITFETEVLLNAYRVEAEMSEYRINLTMSHLLERFGGALGFAEPVVETYREYNYLGEAKVRYLVYDGSGDRVEDLLNYSYRSAEFSFAENGDLASIRIKDGLSCAEKPTLYPIITYDEALKLLYEGHFSSQGSQTVTIGDELITASELIYPSSNHAETIIPYYCFYVECPGDEITDADGNTLTLYRKCYVPAIDSAFIENMPQTEVELIVEEEVFLYDRIMAGRHLSIVSVQGASCGVLLDTEDPDVIAEFADLFDGWSVKKHEQDVSDMDLGIVVSLDDKIIILYSEHSGEENQYYGMAYYTYEKGIACSMPNWFDRYIDSLIAKKSD